MDRVSLIHLSGPSRGETDELNRFPVTLGSEPQLDVVIPGTAPRHATLERRGADVVLRDSGSVFGTFLAGEAIREAVLRDGDIVELGLGGPRLRFRHEGVMRVPFVRAMKWARPEGPEHLSETAAFFRAMARESGRRTSRGFRLSLVAAIALGAGIMVWTRGESSKLQREIRTLQESLQEVEAVRLTFAARVEEERHRAEGDRRTLEGRIEEYRGREEVLRREIAEAAGGEVDALRTELTATRDQLSALESQRAETIIRQYGAGVCLIQGAYGFFDSAGSPLRIKVGETGEPDRTEDGSLALETDGPGPEYIVSYNATGFLVDKTGLVVTNRHVAQQPWRDDPRATDLEKHGVSPHLVRLRAFFPKERAAFDLTVMRIADRVDLALLRLNLQGRRIPVLPLDPSSAAAPGQPVVVIAYPAALKNILAKTDPAVVNETLSAARSTNEDALEACARRGLIRPSTVQGHISDVTATDVEVSAAFAAGSSGGPVFGRDGTVVGVHYSHQRDSQATGYAVPASAAIALVRGRQQP